MLKNELDEIDIAALCKVDWDSMAGDERVRHCAQCQLNVYNLSAMDRAEAEAFVAENSGEACVRLYRRHDGTVLTADCPVGLRYLRWYRRALLAVAVLLTLVGLGGLARMIEGPGDPFIMGLY